jgi:hypothetical protein
MHKWYHKLFRRHLTASLLDAFIVYGEHCNKPVERLSYRVLLVEGLFSKYWATGKRKVG